MTQGKKELKKAADAFRRIQAQQLISEFLAAEADKAKGTRPAQDGSPEVDEKEP